MKCKFPDCFHCDLPDCIRENPEVDLEKARIRNQNYKGRIRRSLQNCNKCEWMREVDAANLNGHIRICRQQNRVIGQNISTCPMWCYRREDDVFKRAHERRVKRDKEKAVR